MKFSHTKISRITVFSNCTGLTASSVQGKLKEKIDFWRKVLKAPEYVLSTIKSGYVLSLKSHPTLFCQSNQQSSLDNFEFVQQSVAELLEKRCIKQLSMLPYICSPLLVVTSTCSSGKKRLIINLRHLYTKTHKFA